MSKLSPPSPDPDGITYNYATNTLIISDSEVEEAPNGITHFAGANIWEMNLNGSFVRSANVSTLAPTLVPMSNEPTGVAWNPNNGHYYFSDDDGKRGVWDLNPGLDGLIGTADDTFTYFSTNSFGNSDPEGIAYDARADRIFVVDGVNMEIYQYTTSGSLVGQFDVQQYGIVDPETVEYNPVNDSLFVMSSGSSPIIVETTKTGVLLQTINWRHLIRNSAGYNCTQPSPMGDSWC